MTTSQVIEISLITVRSVGHRFVTVEVLLGLHVIVEDPEVAAELSPEKVM